ncbi:hypothetical protein INR49_023479 [Caranx melampygus]|nr:hypothetical protein INR49_023479 [Caranx melampygus]
MLLTGACFTLSPVLLNYLPRDHVMESFLKKQRDVYSQFLKEMIIQPGIAKANLGLSREDVTMEDHPLNPNPDSRWNTYFKDNEILLQIDKDVRRCTRHGVLPAAHRYPCQLILDPQNDYRRCVDESSPGKALNLYPSNEYEVCPMGAKHTGRWWSASSSSTPNSTPGSPMYRG